MEAALQPLLFAQRDREKSSMSTQYACSPEKGAREGGGGGGGGAGGGGGIVV